MTNKSIKTLLIRVSMKHHNYYPCQVNLAVPLLRMFATTLTHMRTPMRPPAVQPCCTSTACTHTASMVLWWVEWVSPQRQDRCLTQRKHIIILR